MELNDHVLKTKALPAVKSIPRLPVPPKSAMVKAVPEPPIPSVVLVAELVVIDEKTIEAVAGLPVKLLLFPVACQSSTSAL
jgi:hypothetical protein